MIKKDLLNLVAFVKQQYIKYRIDSAAQRVGSIVLRLPPYHCELNPIELILAQMKQGVVARNATFKLADVAGLQREEAFKLTAGHWAKAVRHAIGIERQLMGDSGASVHVEPIVTHLGEDNMDYDSDMSGIEPLDVQGCHLFTSALKRVFQLHGSVAASATAGLL